MFITGNSGFPKSLDVSKAIDKAAGVEREVIGTQRRRDIRNGPDRGRGEGIDASQRTEPVYLDHVLTAPATDEARRWEGWGTALKPASEHWILCRKPLSEPTVAANVQRWGVGALNVDGCRIATDWASDPTRRGWQGGNSAVDWDGGTTPIAPSSAAGHRRVSQPKDAGRWPANVALSHTLWCTDDACGDGCAVKMLDAQSGERKASGSYGTQPVIRGGQWNAKGERRGQTTPSAYTDTGGASRFFYVAKASRSERQAGVDGEGNRHPTVKPLALCRYLARLVCPPGGIVLDPFAGSGSIGIAAGQEGFQYIGIERDPEYVDIAQRRLAWWTGEQPA